MKHSLAICLLLTSMSSQAALNKWVDAEGKVHYSDSAPSDVKVKTLKSSSAPDAITPVSGVSAPKTLSEREADWKKSQKSKEEDAKKADQEKEAAVIKQKNCESARSNLAGYENSRSIIKYDSKGEPAYLDDAARNQTIENARKEVSKYCN
jgi:hypothetical protein